MQRIPMTAPMALIGTQLQDRYVIESLLGQGGFSAVYMASDLEEPGKHFAVKELRDRDAQEKERFLFECEVLKRLNHPALPSVSHVFEDNERTYMLMEYIEGSNLEVLRRRQVGQRYTLPEVLTLLAPVADAVTYLHSQPIPVLHRDIKPANIIVQGEKTVLVDLGIAKEYYPDATTTAIRHCSPGYGAPEQYSGLGTDLRTDVYGLGATCYALLSGIVPIDALQRTTMLITKGKDPLAAVNELVPSLSTSVARVLQCSLAIGCEQRFATIGEFWQALEQAATQPSVEVQEIQVEEPVITEHGRRSRIVSILQTPLLATRSLQLRILTITIVIVLLAVGAGGFLSGAFVSQHTTTRPTVSNKIVLPTPLSSLPLLNQQYQGTLNDLLTHTTTTMTLTHLQQHGQVISGNFSGMQRKSMFAGVIDTSRHLFFTLVATKDQPSLFFEGSIRLDKYLVGNYCRQDPSGQCVGDYGIWSITPVVSSSTPLKS